MAFFKQIKPSYLAIAVIMLIGIYGRSTKPYWSEETGYGILRYDDFGYYLYLPATFIYDDPTIKNVDWVLQIKAKYADSTAFIQARLLENGNYVIQYTSGNAMIMAPAFFIAHAYALADGSYVADGFSTPYQLGLVIYAFILFFLGLYYLRRVLLMYFDEWITFFLILSVGLGTNIFHLLINNTVSPHVFLFAFYSVLLYLIPKWYGSGKIKYLFWISLIFSVQMLNRPNEIIVGLLILFWDVGSKKELKNRLAFLSDHFKQILSVLPIGIIVVGVQLIYWKSTTGHYIFDSYSGEDFKFLSPYLKEFLFSFKKGWLVYTPIMLLLLPGLVTLAIERKGLLVPITLFTIFYIYVLSSWDCWWYAASFGQRSISQAYPVFLIPIGFLFNSIKQKRLQSIAAKSFVFLCICLNLFQIWQEMNGILHTYRMSQEYYFASFFKTEIVPKDFYKLEINRNNEHLYDTVFTTKRTLYFSGFEDHNGESEMISLDGIAYPSDPTAQLNASSHYTPYRSWTFNEMAKSSEVVMLFSFDYLCNAGDCESDLKLVSRIEDHKSGMIYSWGSEFIAEMDSCSATKTAWKRCSLIYVPPHQRSMEDFMYSYFWQLGESSVNIDNFKIELFSRPQEALKNKGLYVTNFEGVEEGEWTYANNVKRYTHSNYQLLDSTHNFSTTLHIDSINGVNTLEGSAYASVLNIDCKECQLIISIEKNGVNEEYLSTSIAVSSAWQKVELPIRQELEEDSNYVLSAYLWNNGRGRMLIDHIYFDRLN